MDRAGRGAWMSRRIGKWTFQALSMKGRPDEGYGDLGYWLLLQWWARGR